MSNRPFSEENFETVFKTYFGPLCNYVNSYIKDWEGSREIVQSTFTKIWEKKDSIEINTTVQSYLYSSVKNRMIDYIRANNKRNETVEAVGFEEIEEENNSIESLVIRQEILKSLEKLKPSMKKIFFLSKIEGLTYGEVASYLNISKRTVEDNVARALTLLREDLKDNELIFN